MGSWSNIHASQLEKYPASTMFCGSLPKPALHTSPNLNIAMIRANGNSLVLKGVGKADSPGQASLTTLAMGKL